MKKEHRYRLRPMNMTDILDETFELYKTNFWLLMGISAVINIPLVMITGIIDIYGEEDVSLLITILLSIITFPFLTAALTIGISESYLDRKITIGESYKKILRFKIFIRLISVTFLKYILSTLPIIIGVTALFASIFRLDNVIAIVIASFMLLASIFLTVHLFLRLALVEPAVILENKSSLPALKRSWILAKKEQGKIFLVLLIAILLVVFVQLVFSIISIMPESIMKLSHFIKFIGVILSAVGATATTPILSICIILLYYDMRIRKEGFDLEMLANMIGAEKSADNLNNQTFDTSEINSENLPLDSNEPK